MKKIFVFCIAVSFLFLVGSQFCFSDEDINYNAGVDFSTLKVGAEIELGKIEHVQYDYEYEKEEAPITWSIIEKAENNLHLLSKHALENMSYNIDYNSDWEVSNIKDWLDGSFRQKFAGFESSIKNLSLPYISGGKVYIADGAEITDFSLESRNGDHKNLRWWTKTPASSKTAWVMEFLKKDKCYKKQEYSAPAHMYVRPCMTLALSKVIYFDSTNKKFSFVTGESIDEFKNIADSFEISSGEKLKLNIDKYENRIEYKIVRGDELVSRGRDNNHLIDTDALPAGDYDVYLWLEREGDTFNLTSEPKKFTLKVKDDSPQINNVQFSRCGHRKNFESDVQIDLTGKNFKDDDVVKIEFIKDNDVKLSHTAEVFADADEFSFVVDADSLKTISNGEYELKLYLERGGQTLIERQLDFDYVVSDLPVVSEIILSPTSLNISTDEKRIGFNIQLDGLNLNDEVVSGKVYVISDGREIAHTQNISQVGRNYRGEIILPDEIVPGNYEFGSRFKIRNDSMGDEYVITSAAVRFRVSQLKLNMPNADLASGKYFSAQQIKLTADAGAEIFYSLDGRDPNQNSNKFVAPIRLSDGNYNLRAIAYKRNYVPSEILNRNYEIVQSSSSGSSSSESEDKFEVKDENGAVEKLEYKSTNDKIILYPSMENLLGLVDKNEFVNLNLDEKNNVECKLNKNLVSYVANNLSGFKISIKNVGDVTIKNDVFKNLLGHDLEIGLTRLALNIKSDGKDYVPNDFKNNINVSFKYDADKNLDAEKIFLIRKDKNEIVAQSYYDAKQKMLKFKTNMGGKFETGYSDKKFADAKEKAISFLAARKILNGVGQNKFLPDEKIKQADFLIMLMRSIGRGQNIQQGEKYYSGYVDAAQKLSLLNDKNFEPEKVLTLKQMHSMTQKFFDVRKTKLEDKLVNRLQAAKFMYELLTAGL